MAICESIRNPDTSSRCCPTWILRLPSKSLPSLTCDCRRLQRRKDKPRITRMARIARIRTESGAEIFRLTLCTIHTNYLVRTNTQRTAMRPKASTLTDQELEIMKIVWESGPVTVRDVYEEMLKRRKIAYTSVMTMMGVLERKGRLKKTAEQRAYLYSAV